MNSDRVAIITGSSRGIGAATAKLMAIEGYQICVNYRSNETTANAVVSDLVSCGTTAPLQFRRMSAWKKTQFVYLKS